MTDHGRIGFHWTAASHFAAVDHLRSQHRRNRLLNVGILFAGVLVSIALLALGEGGLSSYNLAQLLSLTAMFAVLTAVVWAAFMSRRARRFFVRHGSTVPCALAFGKEGVTVAIGKSPTLYPWSKVRSVDENPQYMFLLASRACFAIPKAAFGSSLEAEEFAASMRRYLGP